MNSSGITAYKLKMIALITMIIDHIGAIIIWRIIDAERISVNLNEFLKFGSWPSIVKVYFIIRVIGRISFPLFLFLMVQGVWHTKNIYKYIANIGIFALVSEIPYDMAFYLTDDQVFSGQLFDWKHQSIMFTLLLVLLMFAGMKKCEEKIESLFVRYAVISIIIVIALVIGIFTNISYSFYGILAAAALYLLRARPVIGFILASAILLWTNGYMGIFAFAGIPIIAKYNGEKGKHINKYLFYAAYPIHLLLLWGFCIFNGYLK